MYGYECMMGLTPLWHLGYVAEPPDSTVQEPWSASKQRTTEESSYQNSDTRICNHVSGKADRQKGEQHDPPDKFRRAAFA